MECGNAEPSDELQASLATPVQIVKKYSHFISASEWFSALFAYMVALFLGVYVLPVRILQTTVLKAALAQRCTSVMEFGTLMSSLC